MRPEAVVLSLPEFPLRRESTQPTADNARTATTAIATIRKLRFLVPRGARVVDGDRPPGRFLALVDFRCRLCGKSLSLHLYRLPLLVQFHWIQNGKRVLEIEQSLNFKSKPVAKDGFALLLYWGNIPLGAPYLLSHST